MKTVRLAPGFLALALVSGAWAADDIFDRVSEALTFTSSDNTIRAHVSGLLDLEGYYTPDTRSDLRFDDDDTLFNPRLSLFLDAQLGEHGYVFAQSRVDRGFDPAEETARVRLDELAVRFAIVPDGRLNLQAGKFATVVGNWTHRHKSWENPFITAPLLYENLTGMWDGSATVSATQLLRRAHVVPASDSAGIASDKSRRLPIIWGPSYASGAAAAGAIGRFEYAVELKNAALSARPASWDFDDRSWGAPSGNGRIGYRPDEAWNFGLSAGHGTYLARTAIPTATPGTSASDYRQTIVGGDLAYAHRHLQCWAEFYTSRFEIPSIGAVRTSGWYVEAKYKFAPQWSGAARWNQQTFSRITGDDGLPIRWGRNVWRLDLALIHRLSAHTQVKLQYSPQHEQPAPRKLTHTVSAQFTTRF
jgi:hypothetical protein